ncbi:MAG: carboxypeptidase regulatory-like domain-containing protein, partial [Sarcina sp.]
ADKYLLGRSIMGKIISKQQELTLDVQLKENTNEIKSQSFISESLPEFSIYQNTTGSNISGKVKDADNNPIKNAVVKLMDIDFNPISNTITDAEGNYSINTSETVSIYTMLAIAPGKTLNQIDAFELQIGESKVINFTLIEQATAVFGTISGKLTDITATNPMPISGAIVSLYTLVNNILTLVAMSYTDSTGVYLFNQVLAGNYTLKFNALGFMPSQGQVTVKTNEIVKPVNTLEDDPVTARGVISGTIKDDNDRVIAGADVILYVISSNNTMSPIAFTTTNSLGRYTFMNIPNGNFAIKSNKLELVTL